MAVLVVTKTNIDVETLSGLTGDNLTRNSYAMAVATEDIGTFFICVSAKKKKDLAAMSAAIAPDILSQNTIVSLP